MFPFTGCRRKFHNKNNGQGLQEREGSFRSMWHPAMAWGSPGLPWHRCHVGVPQTHEPPPAPRTLGCIGPMDPTPLPQSLGLPSDPTGGSAPQIFSWCQGSLPHRYSPTPHAYPSVPQRSSGCLSPTNTRDLRTFSPLAPSSSGCPQDHEVPGICPMRSFYASLQISLMCLSSTDPHMAQCPSATPWPNGYSIFQPPPSVLAHESKRQSSMCHCPAQWSSAS